MFFRKFFFLFLIILFIGAFIGKGGHSRSYSQFQAGWQQGFVAGQQAEPGEDGTTVVVPAPAYPETRSHRSYGIFGFLASSALFFIGFLFLFGLMGMIFGRRHWRHHGKKGWGQKWHKRHHGHSPPWYEQAESDDDEPVMKA